MAKHEILRQARGLNLPFRPVEITDIDNGYHAFIVRYSGDYVHHEHDSDEFVYIIEGVLIIELAGRSSFPPARGTAPVARARPWDWSWKPRVCRSRWTRWSDTAPVRAGGHGDKAKQGRSHDRPCCFSGSGQMAPLVPDRSFSIHSTSSRQPM